MHQVKTSVIAAALALGAASFGGGRLAAQAAAHTGPVGALNAVLAYRVSWMDDSTHFDACSVYRAAGSQQDVASGLLPPLRNLVAAPAGGCDAPMAMDRNREVRVVVDSMSLSPTSGRVFLTVRRGELTHREEYELVDPSWWAVRRVVLSDATRTYFAPPASGAPRG